MVRCFANRNLQMAIISNRMNSNTGNDEKATKDQNIVETPQIGFKKLKLGINKKPKMPPNIHGSELWVSEYERHK